MPNSRRPETINQTSNYSHLAGEMEQSRLQLESKFLKTPVRGFRRGRDTIIIYTDGREQIRSGGTRAWRNNNPGNLENSSFSHRHGSLGDDGRFAIFSSETVGTRALIALLRGSTFQRLSLEDAMGRFAPKTENNPVAYTRFVAQQLQTNITTPLNTLSQGQITQFATAIKRFEGWQQGSVSWRSIGKP